MRFFHKVKCGIYLSFAFGTSIFATPLPSEKVDVVILGGGVAGLTSALYLARAGLSPVVLEGSELGGAIAQSKNVQNFPGYEEISGLDLAEKMRGQAEKSGAILCNEKVTSVDFLTYPIEITAEDLFDSSKRRKILAKSCIIALGSTPKRLGIPGEQTYWSKGVYTCAICDGSLYKDKVVAVVGGGDAAITEAEYLAGLAKKVYILNRKPHFKAVEKQRQSQLLKRSNVEVLYQVEVHSVSGDEEMVRHIEVVDHLGEKTSLKIDALFLAIGSVPNTKLFEKQLELDSSGYIVLKKGNETSIPGVFAAGDITMADPIFKQAVIASGNAAQAALEVPSFLSSRQSEGLVAADSFSKKKEKQDIAQAIEIKNSKQLNDLLSASKVPVVLDFYATWCGPCRHLSRFTDSWARDLQGKAILCKINVDEVRDLALKYQVRAMPTFVTITSEGEEIARKVGTEEIVRYIEVLKKQHHK